MAVITQDTFDPLKSWISVRLQQGVPIVDADWNEADDARRFELRAYLKWFVGDGVPEGNDGFRIAPPLVVSNNFLIKTSAPIPGGTSGIDAALRFAGRCIVDGLDVLITADTAFTAQPLHPNQAGSAALALAWGVPVIDTAPLTSNGVATITVYIDVWERLVTPTEAPSMILPALGIESCARRKREWVVRVAAGNAAPAPAAGHGHYVLARITRPAAVPANIVAAHITDRREQRLLTPPSTLITDSFGGTVADYRKGIGRPATSLRAAINAAMRGELPGTTEALLDPAAVLPVDYLPQMLTDGAGGLIAVWTPTDIFGTANAYAARLDLTNPGAGFSTPPVKLNPAGFMGWFPRGVRMPNGDLLITYVKSPNNSFTGDIVFRRAASLATILAAPEQNVTNSAVEDNYPLPVLAGNFVVFFFQTGGDWRYRRWNHVTSTWVDAVPLVPPNPTAASLHAVADAAGNVWVAMDPSVGINVFRLNPATNAMDASITFNAPSPGGFDAPALLAVGTGMWVFWQGPQGLQYARHSGTWGAASPIPFTSANDRAVIASADDAGHLFIAFARDLGNGQGANYAMSGDPTTLTWGQPMLTAPTTGRDRLDYGGSLLNVPGQGLWLMWLRDASARLPAIYRRLYVPL